jgi:competence protein ComEA
VIDRRTLRALARVLLCVGLLAAGPAARAAEAEAPLSGVVNVNTASAEELELLPGIGPSRARAILEARRERGAFKSLEELEEVKGIGKGALERLRPFVTLSGKTTAAQP